MSLRLRCHKGTESPLNVLTAMRGANRK
jgi:hypothetical protein